MNSTPAETTVQLTDDDKSFFKSLLPIVKALPIDMKLEFRCIAMNKLKELRTSYSAEYVVSFSNISMPIQQQNTLVPPQKTHKPTHTPANLNQPLSISNLNQQQPIMHTPPQVSQQQYSYINLSPVNNENYMDESYPWEPSPPNSHSQHSSYTSPIDRNNMTQ